MRRVRYAVASSVDGFISGPQGQVDWIPEDPDIDFSAIFSQFDTVLMGRRTYEEVLKMGGGPNLNTKNYVFSRTLRQQDNPGVVVVNEGAAETVSALRSQPGKDVWLFGGGVLFRSLAESALVDSVEVAVAPTLLGGGVPLAPELALPLRLRLTGSRVYGSGIVMLEYSTR
jgi:dihydrofolate reductase